MEPREAELWLKLRPQPNCRTWAADHCTTLPVIVGLWLSSEREQGKDYWREMSIRHVNKTERPTLQPCTHWSHLHGVNFWVWACHHIGKLLGADRIFKGNWRFEGPDSTILSYRFKLQKLDLKIKVGSMWRGDYTYNSRLIFARTSGKLFHKPESPCSHLWKSHSDFLVSAVVLTIFSRLKSIVT